ncbi:hypothetical protein [Dyella tabacisoli]|uniref:DUF4625 domain-containing protein n=1 Tax=Dyella tabacisoli TaxID=2282381 RepID=A0A369UKP5_9GAMM|nr:hypothetical protein [Dyella tabacisoli]RDD80675.1 hypothetical protein DVJ77_15690 [Dyella tabacisoli]
MKLSARSAALYSATFAGLLMLSACGKNEPPANAPAAASTAPTPAPASTAPVAPAPASTAAHPATASTAAAPAAANVAPAAPAPATPAAADTSFKIAGVVLGNAVNAEHKVSKAKNSFAPNEKTIYASVGTEGSTSSATLSAKWTYLDKSQLITNTSQSIATEGAATTTFKVVNPNPWPEGKYKVEISLDGKSITTQNFEIKKG